MKASRRRFLKGLSAFVGATQLAGCLGDGGSSPADATSASNAPTAASVASAEAAAAGYGPAPTPSAPHSPTQARQNGGPVWQPSPTIEFVEGVPAVVSVRDFVRDPDSDPLVITLQAGTLIPGLTWNPNHATIAYDGRPLGATDTAPVFVAGIVFSADDGR